MGGFERNQQLVIRATYLKSAIEACITALKALRTKTSYNECQHTASTYMGVDLIVKVFS